jgi:hypothetical protein
VPNGQKHNWGFRVRQTLRVAGFLAAGGDARTAKRGQQRLHVLAHSSYTRFEIQPDRMSSVSLNAPR